MSLKHKDWWLVTNASSSVVSSEHGGCVIIPREQGYIGCVEVVTVESSNAPANVVVGSTRN